MYLSVQNQEQGIEVQSQLLELKFLIQILFLLFIILVKLFKFVNLLKLCFPQGTELYMASVKTKDNSHEIVSPQTRTL